MDFFGPENRSENCTELPTLYRRSVVGLGQIPELEIEMWDSACAKSIPLQSGPIPAHTHPPPLVLARHTSPHLPRPHLPTLPPPTIPSPTPLSPIWQNRSRAPTCEFRNIWENLGTHYVAALGPTPALVDQQNGGMTAKPWKRSAAAREPIQ